ncbi:MAG TPA: peptidyl-prolyl cis-trans isomerase [Solirubrobacteraceae bacterium]|nr:peptidyl-prolyl cis-trans isomerase [Solirubrobacteraceae bacterium]
MMRLRRISALAAIAALPLLLAACGDGVPGNSVARVDDSLIKKTAFDHWLNVAARSQTAQTGGAASVPDAPSYTKCVASKRQSLPKPPKGQKAPTAQQLKQQCQQEYEGLRDQVLQFLISAEWIQKEAGELDVSVSNKDVQKQFQQTKKQSFPKDADYQKFLKQSGMSQEDVVFRVKLDALSNKIRDKITKGKDKVTQQQIAAYYNKNKKRFAQPERRDLRVVLTKTEAQANAAKKALDGGDPWNAVAKKYSIDQATKSTGGKLPAVTKGQQDRALENAAFKAPKGKVEGPVKTQFGYYVYEVDKVTGGSQQSLKQSEKTIKQLLASENQQKALNDFVKDFQKKWKDETTCRKGFITQDCSNAPEPKKGQQTTPPGAVPQQGQGGAPQGGAGAGAQQGQQQQQVPVPQQQGGQGQQQQQVPVPQEQGGQAAPAQP